MTPTSTSTSPVHNIPKALVPPTPYITHTLRSTQSLLQLFHARNGNQHRRAVWYRHFSLFRREVRRLAQDLALSASRHASAALTKKAQNIEIPVRRRVEKRLSFWREASLVERWYRAFTHLISTTQFSAQGLTLLALLARVSSITGFTKWYKELTEQEDEERQEAVRKVLREFGEERELQGEGTSSSADLSSGAAEDLGEVVSRDEG